MYSQSQLKKIVILIPIFFSFFYAFLIYFFTLYTQKVLTSEVREGLATNSIQLLAINLLILIPNLFLSLIMYIYSNTAKFSGTQVLIPCISAIIGGLIPVLYIYYFFYFEQSTTITKIPVLSYGFPFVYFFGMMIGWLMGVFAVVLLSNRSKN